jgi:glycogen phosphorylase
MNSEHLHSVRASHGMNDELQASVSLIDEKHERRIRMGHLAFVGSHKVNGVSELHTGLMRNTVFADLHRLHSDRIVNKTNAISFRRWLQQANPGLTSVLVEAVGDSLLDHPTALEKLAELANDSAFHERLARTRRANKSALVRIIADTIGVKISPDAVFDVHVKRIHEYKRQLLNVLETIAIYNAMRAQPMRQRTPRVKIFAGKAAPGYRQAKLLIKLVNDVARVVNTDPIIGDLLKIVFLPNYNVSLAEKIIPAADLSEQISTAGTEASGTGNMKLALNGALTIGTLDGANIEIAQRVGNDNIFIFGLTSEEVQARRRHGYDPGLAIEAAPILSEVLDAIASGVFSPDDPTRYHNLVETLRTTDPFFVTADFIPYYDAQREVYKLWRDRSAWWRASVLNTANMGWFSSDRALREYAGEIWNVGLAAGKRNDAAERGFSGVLSAQRTNM